MSDNYSKLSLEQLKKERAKIEKAISIQEDKDKKSAMAKVMAIAKASGLDLADIVNGAKPARAARATKKGNGRKRKKMASTGRKVPPKYRNPNDVSQTWTGRGKQPVWVREHLEKGGTLESVSI